jgi:osmotically-inducible protein OsmY
MRQLTWAALSLAAALSLQTGCASTSAMSGSSDDQRITAAARAKLSAFPSLRISARNGVVYVVGAVGTAAQKDTVERLILEVPGVKEVSSDIGVGPYVPTW